MSAQGVRRTSRGANRERIDKRADARPCRAHDGYGGHRSGRRGWGAHASREDVLGEGLAISRVPPSDLDAEVHSQSAVGEQYVALLPRGGESRPLADGDVVPRARTSVPPDINSLLDATNRALEAIPQDNLETVIDESYTAVGALGPELSRIVKGSSRVRQG